MAATISASDAVLPSGMLAGALGKAHSAWAVVANAANAIAAPRLSNLRFISGSPALMQRRAAEEFGGGYLWHRPYERPLKGPTAARCTTATGVALTRKNVSWVRFRDGPVM